MQQIVPINLEERIITAITDLDSELWFPHLTYDLMKSGLNKLYEETGITESEYGTSRVIYKNPDAKRVHAGFIFTTNERGEIRDESFIEILPSEIADEYKKQGVEFYSSNELLKNNEVTECLKDAFEIIRYVPTLFTSVRFLVKSIHLIKLEDDEYDISFSEPHIPFSIFVSVPRKNSPINVLRVAEAIIHEAMHLQLTLIENVIPLVVPGGNLSYSPWKDGYRNPQGLLHGIYVFKVIRQFLSILNNSSLDIFRFRQSRIKEIDKQLFDTSTFVDHSSLTDVCRKFIKNGYDY